MSDTTYKVDAVKAGARMVRFGWKWVVTMPKPVADAITVQGQTVEIVNVPCGGKSIDSVRVLPTCYVTKGGTVWTKVVGEGAVAVTRVALVTEPKPVADPAPSASTATTAASKIPADDAGESAEVVALKAQLAIALAAANRTMTPALSAGLDAARQTPKGSRPAKRQSAPTGASVSVAGGPQVSLDSILSD